LNFFVTKVAEKPQEHNTPKMRNEAT